MTRPVRLAIIGCGDHVYETLMGQLRWAPENDLVGVADIRQDRLDRFARFYRVDATYLDYKEMLSAVKPDAVIVSVGHDEHPVIAADALRAGSHVFVEKSPCVTERQALDLDALSKETGRWVMVGWQRRFMPAYVMAHEISRRPEFGQIHMFQSQVNAAPYRDDEYFKINHVVHHLDLARFFMGEIELTQVQRVELNPKMLGYTISFRAADGGIGTIQSGSFLDPSHPMERMEILGHHRNIVVENFRQLRYNRPSTGPKGNVGPFALADTGDSLVWDQRHRFDPRTTYRGFEDEIHHFVTCVASGEKPKSDIAESAATMALLERMSEMASSDG
jgi:predicted dehydrogenase